MAGIYIHIPFCKSKCRYCDFTSYTDKYAICDAYMACVYREMQMYKDRLKNYVFNTVYFGGGTPSTIDPKFIYGALKEAKKCFRIAPDAEITIEMNPGTVTKDKIEYYKKIGINRFSVGLQTGVDAQLFNLGRIHRAQDFASCASYLRGTNFSADVMIGLQDQTAEDVQKTIEFAVGCGASHVSMYALTPEDGTPMYTDYLNGLLPDGDETAEMYEAGYQKLKELGFTRYEVSNFSKKGKESRHNINYWKRGEYIGFGVDASSFIDDMRFTNTKDMDEYTKCIISGHLPVVFSERIGAEKARFEFIMLGLRMACGINLNEYAAKFGGDFESDFQEAIAKNRDYLVFEGGNVRIRDEYLYVQNTILMDFLEYEEDEEE